MGDPRPAYIGDHDYSRLADFFYREMLHHTRKSQEESLHWERKKPVIKSWLKRKPANKQDFALRAALKGNWTLSDHMDAWSWHEREAKLMAANLEGLNAYLCIKNLLSAPAEWPA